MEATTSAGTQGRRDYEVVIIGGGFAGIYALHRARKLGLSVRLFEAGEGIGGTWFWNRYPGAACDIESLEYSYSFDDALQQEWSWSHRFAYQPEILKYINHVADRFGLREDIQLNTRVQSAVFDEAKRRWEIRTNEGDVVTGRHCVMATGCLSAPKPPEYPGLKDFKGEVYHTAYWPKEGVDFTGKRVAVIGTGSSAIQSIPIIAEQAKHLTVFQRTPNFSVPARNRPMDKEYERRIKDNYADLRRREYDSDLGICAALDPETKSALEVSAAEREAEYEMRWQTGGLYFYTSYVDLLVNKEANDTVVEFAHRKIREKVKDQKVADLLCPTDHPFGAKRICADTNYYETYNRDNVSLISVRQNPIEGFTEKGIKTKEREYEFDAIVFATGFDAMTGALFNIDLRGRDGLRIQDSWAAGPRTYLGVMTAGFPNLYITTGPGSPSVLYNMVLGNEYHVNWIIDCIDHLNRKGVATIEADVARQDEWVNLVNEIGHATLFPKANSWYMGANVPGKPRVILPYLGGFRSYSKVCNEVAANGYNTFILTGA